MITTRNITNLYITNLDSAGTLVKSGVATDLTSGQLALVDGSNTIINITDTPTNTLAELIAKYGSVRIAINEGGTLRFTDYINLSNLMNVCAKEYKAAVEKVTCIGYDGVSASTNIQSLAGNYYYLSINDLSHTKFNQDFPLYHYAEYNTSVSSAYSQDIAAGLITQLILSYSQQPLNDRFIKFERLMNNTSSTGNVTGCAAAYGSRTVTKTAHGLTAGTIIKFGAASAISPTYIIASAATDSFELDVPYQGASTASITIHTVTGTPATDKWGIRLTGIPRIFAVGKYQYDKADWKIQLKNFGTTTVTETTALVFGSGTYEQVAEMEWDLFGNETNWLRADAPQIDVRKTASSTCTYDMTIIKWYEKDNQKIVENEPIMYKTIILATNAANPTTNTRKVVLGAAGAPEGLLAVLGGVFYA